MVNNFFKNIDIVDTLTQDGVAVFVTDEEELPQIRTSLKQHFGTRLCFDTRNAWEVITCRVSLADRWVARTY